MQDSEQDKKIEEKMQNNETQLPDSAFDADENAEYLTEEEEEEEDAEDQNTEEDAEKQADIFTEIVRKENIGGKKMIRNIIISSVVLIFLIVGAIVAVKLQSTEEEVYPSKVLIDTEATSIERIDVVNNQDENFTITPVIVAEEQNWAIEGIDFEDVAQYNTNLFAIRCYYLEADKVVGTLDGVDLEQFGLKNPAVTVTVKYIGDSKTRTFYLGDEYSGGGYYLYEKGVNELYIVEDFVGQYWSYSLNQLRELPTLSIASADLSVISLEYKGRTKLTLSYIAGTLAGTESWQVLEPVYVRTDEDKMTTYLESVTQFACTGYEAEKVGDDLSKYGFDDPEAKVVLLDYTGEKTQFILLGDIVPDTEGTRYCVIMDSDSVLSDMTVYSVEVASQGIFSLKLLDIMDPFILSTNIDWVQDGTFTIKGKEYKIRIDRTPKLDDDGKPTYDTSGNPISDSKFYINDLFLNEDQFRTFYGKFVMMQVDGEMSASDKTGDEYFSYSFDVKVPILSSDEGGETTFRDAQYTAEMWVIDENFLALRTNENTDPYFKVNRRSIDALAEALDLLLAGTLPTD